MVVSLKSVRSCTACDRPLTLPEIVYSSDYPEAVTTSKGTERKGALADAARVWCSAGCATVTYQKR